LTALLASKRHLLHLPSSGSNDTIILHRVSYKNDPLLNCP